MNSILKNPPDDSPRRSGLYIRTYGCQMNLYDSRRMSEFLADDYRRVPTPEEAELIVVNTCSVREGPQHKVYAELNRLSEHKKSNPHVILAVCGCVAQQEKDRMFQKVPALDLCFGPDAVPHIRELVERVKQEGRQRDTRFVKGGFHLEDQDVPLALETVEGSPVTEFVAIQKGCDKFCSYCIVPYTRGREKSRPMEEILREIQWLAEGGVLEVTLLGQNVNAYGLDFGDEHAFSNLLRRASEVPGIERIRFVTSHPAHVNEDFARTLAELPKVCPYLHLPIQAGADRVLEAMNRGYTRAQYMNHIEMLRRWSPNLALSGDIIVGFPGETYEEFRETVDAIEEIRYESLFSFVYSARPGTKAAKLDDPVPREEKLEWLHVLQDRQKRITHEINESYLDTKQEVLIEGCSKKDTAEWMGRTPSNKIVNFPAENAKGGDLVTVNIVQAMPNTLRGECLGLVKSYSPKTDR